MFIRSTGLFKKKEREKKDTGTSRNLEGLRRSAALQSHSFLTHSQSLEYILVQNGAAKICMRPFFPHVSSSLDVHRQNNFHSVISVSRLIHSYPIKGFRNQRHNLFYMDLSTCLLLLSYNAYRTSCSHVRYGRVPSIDFILGLCFHMLLLFFFV